MKRMKKAWDMIYEDMALSVRNILDKIQFGPGWGNSCCISS